MIPNKTFSVWGVQLEIFEHILHKKYLGYLHDLEGNPYEFFQSSFTI